MKFWNSSAIIPLCIKEPATETVHNVIRTDEDIVAWWTTHLECVSTLSRRGRGGVLLAEAERKARAILSRLSAEWSEVQSTELVRRRAERLLAIHPLRAADALQLAAALVWAEEIPQGLEMVCLDQNLCEAAMKEGFTVLPEWQGCPIARRSGS